MTGTTLYLGDCLDVLAALDAESIDACVSDPPYHLTSIVKRFGKPGSAPAQHGTDGAFARASAGFMGKQWDGGDVAFRPETWAAVSRVLKPGAYLLAFGGTRTYHRLAVAIEDAGFEIRDTVMWVYGSGFPKSHNLDGDREGWGTALKPAWEPIVVARKPLAGTVAENVAEHGTGAINIDGCRVGSFGEANPSVARRKGAVNHLSTRPAAETEAEGRMASRQSPEAFRPEREGEALGRWPANLIHDGSDEVLAAFPTAPGQMADASSSSSSRKTQNVYGDMKRGNGREGEPSADDPNVGAVGFKMKPGARRIDSGSAARFFYCAKASRSDRNDGLGDDFAEKPLNWSSGTESPGTSQSDGTHKAAKNNHPTVKPTDLMRYLCRLVTPPGGTVLDPFMGSGSTGRGAVLEGFGFIGIEKEPDYFAIAQARIAACDAAVTQRAAGDPPVEEPDGSDLPLFGGIE